MEAYRFLVSTKGVPDERLIDLVTAVRPILDNGTYWSDLLEMCGQAQLACARSGNQSKRVQLMLVMTQMHINMGAYDIAIKSGFDTAVLALQIHDLETLANSHLCIGWSSLYLGKFAQALKHLSKGIWFADRVDHLPLLSSCLHFTARVCYEIGDFLRALKYSRAELMILRKIDTRGIGAYSWLRNAEILLELRREKTARRIILRILHQIGSTDSEVNPAPILLALARVKLQEGAAEEALQFLAESRKGMNYRRGEMHVLESMAVANIRLGKVDQALELLNVVIAYRESAKEDRRLADALYLKGWALELCGDVQEAIEYYRDSLKLFEEMNCLPTVSEKARRALDQLWSVSESEDNP